MRLILSSLQDTGSTAIGKASQTESSVPDSAQHGSTGGAIARYIMTSVELKTSTHSKGSQSLSIDNSILWPLPKHLLFVIMDNKDFLGSLDTNSFDFHHYDTSYFTLYVNGKQMPIGGLH